MFIWRDIFSLSFFLLTQIYPSSSDYFILFNKLGFLWSYFTSLSQIIIWKRNLWKQKYFLQICLGSDQPLLFQSALGKPSKKKPFILSSSRSHSRSHSRSRSRSRQVRSGQTLTPTLTPTTMWVKVISQM